jgi:hypothetical protein
MAELQICSVSNPIAGGYKRGEIIKVYSNGHLPDGEVWNSPKSVYLKIPDASVGYVENNFTIPWKRVITFTPTWYAAQKGYRIELTATNLSVLAQGVNYGKVSKDMIENYLNKWGCTVHSFGDNSVTFDAGLFNVLTSNGFWGLNVSNVDFTEESWDSDNNIMTVEADISNIRRTVEDSSEIIEDAGGTVISTTYTPEVSHIEKQVNPKTLDPDDPRPLTHIDVEVIDVPEVKKVTFTMSREIVNQTFKNGVKSKLEDIILHRQKYINSTAVNAIIANGGVYQVSKAVALNYVNDRLTEI